MKLLKKLKEKKGFTLVESMIAIAILAIATTTFAVFLATTNRMTVLTLQNEKDYQLLQEIISTGVKPNENITVAVLDKDAAGNKPSFSVVFDANTKVEVEGQYVVVENPNTGQHFVIFVGDNINANP